MLHVSCFALYSFVGGVLYSVEAGRFFLYEFVVCCSQDRLAVICIKNGVVSVAGTSFVGGVL